MHVKRDLPTTAKTRWNERWKIYSAHLIHFEYIPLHNNKKKKIHFEILTLLWFIKGCC